MTLKLNAQFCISEVQYYVEADSVSALREAILSLKAETAPATKDIAAPAPTPDAKAEGTKAKKLAAAEKSAASAPPATPKETAPPAASETKAPAAPDTYEKTGLGEKIAAFLGEKEAPGYAERRAGLVTLLTQFSVKKGPELKPDQFAAFGEAFEKLANPAEEDLG